MRNIIKLILIVIVLTLKVTANNNWIIVDSLPWFSYGSITDLKCADSLNCIYHIEMHQAGGNKFVRTTDGGITWKAVYTDSFYIRSIYDYHLAPRINSISYPNPKLFIAVGDSGLVLRSTDKGETWDSFRLNKNLSISGTTMYDEYIGDMGMFGKYPKDTTSLWCNTTDGGLTWECMAWPRIGGNKVGVGGSDMKYLSKDLLIGDAQFPDKYNIYHSYIIYIRDNWKSWDTVRIPDSIYQQFFTFVDEKHIWTAGGSVISGINYNQKIFRTTDGGINWQKQRDTFSWGGAPMVDIEFYDENFGIASSEHALILMTDNGGEVWDEEHLEEFSHDGSTKKVGDIQIPGRNSAFVVYRGQYIYKWTRPGTDVAEESQSGFSVSPNPAGDYIEIRIEEPALKGVSVANEIRICNIFGECLNSTPAGEGALKIDVSNLPAGIYFISIGNFYSKFVKL